MRIHTIDGLLQSIRENTILNDEEEINPTRCQDDSCLFSDSVLAQRRDEKAAQQKRPPVKVIKTGNASTSKQVQSSCQKVENAVSMKCDSTSRSIKSVSRAGRQIRSPVTFWKANESKMNDTVIASKKKTQPKVSLNDSMTLRNNKVIDRNPTPPLKAAGKGSSKSTPLSTINEINNDIRDKIAQKPQNKLKAVNNSEDKENSVKLTASKKRQTSQNEAKKQLAKEKKEQSLSKNKKQVAGHNKNSENDKTTSEKLLSKTKGERKETDSSKQVKQKSTKSDPRKRKSTEQDDTQRKKKKVENDVASIESEALDMSSSDELFGAVTYKRTTQPITQALSPSRGLLSAKKAAGEPLGKETPPCKLVGQMMSNTSSHSLASSVIKDAPVSKPNKVVKRATKIVETNQRKAAQKPAAKTSGKKSQKDVTKKLLELPKARLTTFTYRTGFALETDEEMNDSYYDDDDDDLS